MRNIVVPFASHINIYIFCRTQSFYNCISFSAKARPGRDADHSPPSSDEV
jgi:hypothetical protein